MGKGVVMSKKELIKSLGLLDVFCIATGAMISSGIFILPGVAFEKVGPAMILGYLLAGVFACVGSLATIELATAMPLAGGIYYYTERSLGPLAGTISGLLNWSAIALKSSFAIFGMSELLYQLIGTPRLACGICLTIFFLLVNLIGTNAAAWAQDIMVFILLGAMGLFFVAGVPSVEFDRFTPFFAEGKGNIGEVMALAAFVFVAFGGLLDVASVSEEVKNPKRNMPLGMLGGIITVTLLYGFVLFITVGVLPGKDLSGSLTPLADAAQKTIRGSWGYWIITVGAMMAFVTTANAGIMAAARFPFALSRDKLIPGVFSRVYGKKQLPLPSLLLTGAVMVASLFLDLESLVTVASTVIMLSFILTNISVIILRESEIQNYRPTFRTPFYPVLPLLSMLAFVWLILQMGLGAVQIAIGIVLLAVVLYFIFGRKVHLEFALMHLVARISKCRISGHGLETELRDILRDRDGIVQDDFDDLVEHSSVMILDQRVSLPDLFDLVSRKMAPVLGCSSRELDEKLLIRESESSTVISPTVAIPHLTLEGRSQFRMMMVKCTEGIEFTPDATDVNAVIFLFGSPDRRNFHLRSLAAIAQTIQGRSFESRWRKARTPEQLQDVFLLGKRRRGF